MIRRSALAAVLVAAAIAVALLALPRRDPPPVTTVAQGVPPLPDVVAAAADGPILAWSSRSEGRFEPCGCVAGMYGGLVRRATLLGRVAPERLLSLELGGWSPGADDHQRLRAPAYLAGLAAAGIDAVALGKPEAALGAEVLAGHLAAAASAGIPVVCANLDGVEVRPWVAVSAGGRTWAVTSVIPDRAPAGPGLRLREPAAALRPVLAAGLPVLVMADMDEAGLRALAAAVPSLDLVVGGDVQGPTTEPEAVGRVRVLHVANHGKSIGWWPVGGDRLRFELIADTIPDHPGVRAVERAHQRTLARTPLAIDRPASDPGWVGSQTCMGCHQGAHATWAASRHAHAHEALVRKGMDADPDCLRCHVTGLGQGGHRRLSGPGPLAAVTCESCHGPGRDHIAAPGPGTMVPVSPATCVGCHDAENSPRFDYTTYWPRIAH
ncbi:MAG: hypothetical protein RLZZ127_3294 [Planctomycetota bacterium]|jgi:hypothetical protein